MKFDSRGWKLDLENLWWNADRLKILNSLLSHFKNGGGPAHLTGGKGVGKSTLSACLGKKLDAITIRMQGLSSFFGSNYWNVRRKVVNYFSFNS